MATWCFNIGLGKTPYEALTRAPRVPIASRGASSDEGGGRAGSTDVGNDTTHQPPRYPIRARTKQGYLDEYVTNNAVDE